MTDEVIANYFLKAGASFRRSVAWKKEFESEVGISERAQFKSRVLRSGRFGIGVLAAFLLGDEIEVSTRYITNQRGIGFSLRLDLGPPALEIAPIQLNYLDGLPVGTTVKIKVTKVKRARLEKRGRDTTVFGTDIFSDPYLWDWYCLKAPSVLRLRGRDRKILEQSATVPPEGPTLPRGWHLLPSSHYRTVHVLVHGPSGTHAPGLVCNGIKVRETDDTIYGLLATPRRDWKTGLFPGQGVFKLRTPDFSVFDPDGNLPLNLQRTKLTNLQFDFLTEAFAAQARAALAKLVLSAPPGPRLTDELRTALSDLFEFEQVIPVFFTSMGTALLTLTNLRLAQVRNCLLVGVEAVEHGWPTLLQERYGAVVVACRDYHGSSAIYALNRLNQWVASARVITRSEQKPIVAKPLRFRYKDCSCDGLNVYRTANCPPSFLRQEDFHFLKGRSSAPQNATESTGGDDFIAAELFLKDQPHREVARPEFSLGNYWETIIRQPMIPFDSAERLRKLKHAYSGLREYLADFSDPAKDV